MSRARRLVLAWVFGLGVAAAAAWGTLVLWFTLPVPEVARGVLALLFAVLGLAGP